jgi:hypothetical protein
MMATYNLKDSNGTYYFGHEPGNGGHLCCNTPWRALVLTLKQARELNRVLAVYSLDIVISPEDEPITDMQFRREIFCARDGGNWNDWQEGM